MRKWANELKRVFSKEEVQMTKPHKNKFSTSLAIKEMQVKTTLRIHLTPVRMSIIEGIPRWQLEGGSRKQASYSETLERRWRHTLQA
jgi:hypothetical protein